MKHIKQLFITLILSAFIVSPAFAAFEGLGMMRMGDWEVGFSGNANAFLTNGECDGKGSRYSCWWFCLWFELAGEWNL